MIGWAIAVHRPPDVGAVRTAFARAEQHPRRELELSEEQQGPLLVVYSAGGYGDTDWIEELSRSDGGCTLKRGGYSDWYLIPADRFLSVLRTGPPGEQREWTHGDDILMPNWVGRTTLDNDEIAATQADDWLLVSATDRS